MDRKAAESPHWSDTAATVPDSTADPEAAAPALHASWSVPQEQLQQQQQRALQQQRSLPAVLQATQHQHQYQRQNTAAPGLARHSYGLQGLQGVKSGSVAGSQSLQEADDDDLVDPWSRDAASDELSGTVVLAEETFMQHVTRVYKVSKRVWDFYTKLSKQTVVAAADDQQSPDMDQSRGWAHPTSDPTAFRFRTTFEDVPNVAMQSITPDTWLTTTSQKTLGAASVTSAAAAATAGGGAGHLGTAGTTWEQQKQQKEQQGQQALSQGSPEDAEPVQQENATPLQLRLRPSIFLLPVMSPEHRVACIWSFFMLCMDMVYIAFIMPLFMAFCPVVPGGLNWCGAIDLAAGLVYAVNLVMSFQIGFILEHDYKKRMLIDGLHVARFYVLRGTFFIDFMATLPVLYQIIMVSGRIYNYWANRCLTFTMLLRLLRLVQLMKVLFVDSLITSGNTGMSRHISVLGQYALVALYAAAVLMHNLACLAWLVALMEGPENSWAVTVNWASEGPGSLPDGPPAEQYLAGLYWVFTTVTTTGYGDVVPRTPLDALLCMMFMLCGVSMVALLIGSMTELLTQATSDARRARAFRQKMTEVDEWVTRRNIPGKLKHAIRNYYNQVWLHHQDHPTEAAILSELPTSLRGRVAQHITAGLLDSLHMMRGLDGAVREDLASRLVPVEVAPGHELCRAGDEADCLWLLQEGELLYIRGHGQVQLLGPPCLLGEYCLLASEVPELSYRPATLRALSSCQLWQLSIRELRTLMIHHPELEQRLMDAARESVARNYDVITASDSGSPSSGLPQQQQQQQGLELGLRISGPGSYYNLSRSSSQHHGSSAQQLYMGAFGGLTRPGQGLVNRGRSGLTAHSVPAAAAAAGRVHVSSSSANSRSLHHSSSLTAQSVPVAATAAGTLHFSSSSASANDSRVHRQNGTAAHNCATTSRSSSSRAPGTHAGQTASRSVNPQQLHAVSLPLPTVYSGAVSNRHTPITEPRGVVEAHDTGQQLQTL